MSDDKIERKCFETSIEVSINFLEQINALKANNAALRKALNDMLNDSINHNWGEVWVVEAASKALADIPEPPK